MKSQIDIDIEVTATDNKLRTGIDAEIAILKLTGYVSSRFYPYTRLQIVEWAACKLVEIGVVDPIAAEQAFRKQEDNFVIFHMRKYSNIRRGRQARHLYRAGIANTYVRSRFDFYKERLPKEVAMQQARYEFSRLVVRLRKEKISYEAIGKRFGVKAERARQAFFSAAWRRRDPIESYFEWQDFL
jgi:hypothetical protein